MFSDMTSIFEQASNGLLESAAESIMLGVAERSLCGSLTLHVRRALDGTPYEPYHVDFEYNRNEGGRLKTIINGNEMAITKDCDLVVHSRGEKYCTGQSDRR